MNRINVHVYIFEKRVMEKRENRAATREVVSSTPA